jgi:TRL-like protein family
MNIEVSSAKIVVGIALFSLSLGGCGLIYTNVHVPRAYRSATSGDVPNGKTDKIVSGEACNQSVFFLVAWGNGGYAAAVKNALQQEPSNAMLYDVTADARAQSILFGLYTRLCTVVTGKVAHL